MRKPISASVAFMLLAGCTPAPAPQPPVPVPVEPADQEPPQARPFEATDEQRPGVHVDVGGVKVDVQRKPDEPQE
jgi:hypothetical protein